MTPPIRTAGSDTLSMPVGKGGLKKIGLYVDVCSGNALPKAATGRSTRAGLTKVWDSCTDPETFITGWRPRV